MQITVKQNSQIVNWIGALNQTKKVIILHADLHAKHLELQCTSGGRKAVTFYVDKVNKETHEDFDLELTIDDLPKIPDNASWIESVSMGRYSMVIVLFSSELYNKLNQQKSTIWESESWKTFLQGTTA